MPALSSVGLNSERLSFATASSTACLFSAVSSRSPEGAAKTTFSTPPCSDANSDSIRSVAFCVSEPGMSNSSFRLPPTVTRRAIKTTTIPIQLRKNAARMRRAGSVPARKAARRESFVGCSVFRRSLRHCGGSFGRFGLHRRHPATVGTHRYDGFGFNWAIERRGTPSRYSTTTLTPSSRAASGSRRAAANAAGGAEVA